MSVIKVDFAGKVPADFVKLVSQLGGTAVEEVPWAPGTHGNHTEGFGKDLWARKFTGLLDIPPVTIGDAGKCLQLLPPGDPSGMTVTYDYPTQFAQSINITIILPGGESRSVQFNGSGDVTLDFSTPVNP